MSMYPVCSEQQRYHRQKWKMTSEMSVPPGLRTTLSPLRGLATPRHTNY